MQSTCQTQAVLWKNACTLNNVSLICNTLSSYVVMCYMHRSTFSLWSTAWWIQKQCLKEFSYFYNWIYMTAACYYEWFIRCSPFVRRLIIGICSHFSINAPMSHRIVSCCVGRWNSWNHDRCAATFSGISAGALLCCSFFRCLSISHATSASCAFSWCSSGTSVMCFMISSNVWFKPSVDALFLLSDESEMSEGDDSDLILKISSQSVWHPWVLHCTA